jgi:hypothetical protein
LPEFGDIQEKVTVTRVHLAPQQGLRADCVSSLMTDLGDCEPAGTVDPREDCSVVFLDHLRCRGRPVSTLVQLRKFDQRVRLPDGGQPAIDLSGAADAPLLFAKRGELEQRPVEAAVECPPP